MVTSLFPCHSHQCANEWFLKVRCMTLSLEWSLMRCEMNEGMDGWMDLCGVWNCSLGNCQFIKTTLMKRSLRFICSYLLNSLYMWLCIKYITYLTRYYIVVLGKENKWDITKVSTLKEKKRALSRSIHYQGSKKCSFLYNIDSWCKSH